MWSFLQASPHPDPSLEVSLRKIKKNPNLTQRTGAEVELQSHAPKAYASHEQVSWKKSAEFSQLVSSSDVLSSSTSLSSLLLLCLIFPCVLALCCWAAIVAVCLQLRVVRVCTGGACLCCCCFCGCCSCSGLWVSAVPLQIVVVFCAEGACYKALVFVIVTEKY